MFPNDRSLSRDEREFEEFQQQFDLEVFCLELAYNEKLAQGVRTALELKQSQFDRQLANRPEAIAERERWQKNREEMAQRQAASRRVLQQATRQLARRWSARLVLQEV